MGVLKDNKKEKFVQNCLKGMDKSDAYKAVYPNSKKWKPATVWSHASTLAAEPEVAARFEELKKQAADKAVLSYQERREVLSKMALDKAERSRDRMQAIDILNKMDGAYVQKVEASVATPVSDTARAIAAIMEADDGT